MPRNSDSKEVKFLRVVQAPLMPDMVESVKSLVRVTPDVEKAFFEYISQGYALTAKPNPRGGYSASAMCAEPSSPNAGLMVFANGKTAHLAVAALVVKLDVLNQNQNWSTVEDALGGDDFS